MMRHPRSLEVIVLLALSALIVPLMLGRESASAEAAPMRPPDFTTKQPAQHNPRPTEGIDKDILLYLPLGLTLSDASSHQHYTRSMGATPTFDRHGIEGGATIFAGQDYIEIDRPQDFDNLQGFTLSAWVRPTVRQEHLNVISKVTPHRDFNLQIDHLGRPVSHIMNNGYEFCYAKRSVPLNEWSFLAATYSEGVWNMYINGTLDSTVKVSKSPVWESKLMTVGALYPDAEGFIGDLDEVRVHSRALSADEISKLGKP